MDRHVDHKTHIGSEVLQQPFDERPEITGFVTRFGFVVRRISRRD